MTRLSQFIAALSVAIQAFALAGLSGVVHAADPLAPTSKLEDALVSQLKSVTIASNSLPESLLFYRDGMGMTVDGPLKLNSAARQLKRKAWGLSRRSGFDVYRLHRPGVSDAAEIELVVFKQIQPAIQRSWGPRALGGFSLGFPNLDQAAQDAKLRALGFGALNALESYSVPRADGSRYDIVETIFNAPDFVHVVGIHRGGGMSQLGGVDQHGLGGPAYSALIVADAQKMIAFFTEVLGWELRSDRSWKTSSINSALGVPVGTAFRFAILYAKGASSGHVLLLQFDNLDIAASAHAPRLPHRGLGMWTMHSQDLATVRVNAKKFGSKVLDLRAKSVRPSLLLTAPNGLQIRVEQN